jgi:hypothetical protein
MTPRIRQTIYRLGTVASGVLGIALIWGGISQGTADHINTVMAGLIALLSGGAPAIAARTVKEQAKSGAFDSVPPAEQAITAIQATIEQAITAQADVQRVTDAVTNALSNTPVGPVVSAAGSVVEQVIRASTR